MTIVNNFCTQTHTQTIFYNCVMCVHGFVNILAHSAQLEGEKNNAKFLFKKIAN